jgi:hypothetical protein
MACVLLSGLTWCFAGCAAPDAPTISSFVTRDGRVVAEPNAVPAGEVIIRIQNDRNERERMVLVRTGRAPGALPVVGHVVPLGKESDTDFEGNGYELIVRLDPMKAYFSGAPIVMRMHDHLDPGTYELFSNLPGHYESGRFTRITIVLQP